MNIVYPNGLSADIAIAAGETLAYASEHKAEVFQVVGYPNVPDTVKSISTLNNGHIALATFTSAATLRIQAGALPVYYEVGVSPRVANKYNSQLQGAPAAKTTATTLTAAELLTGLITGTHAAGANQNYGLPTGTNMDLASEMAIGESFDWTLANLSAAAADTITLTAAAGHTVVGVMVAQSVHATTGGLYGSSIRLRTRKTAANTFITYRLG